MLEYVLPEPTWNGRSKTAPLSAAGRVHQRYTRQSLGHLFVDRGYRHGAEVGVADGRFSLYLCQTIPHLHLLCIDPWKPYAGNRRGGGRTQHELNFALAQERLAAYHVEFWRMKSDEAAVRVVDGSLDFVYLDANHDSPYVDQDLGLWAPKVRAGGVLAGHDYYHFAHAGVVSAVNMYVQRHAISEWYLTDEREPSFWWTVNA